MALDQELLAAALPRYEIGDEIGRGGWGIVLRGRHRELDREVAIKQLPRAFGADPAVRDRFIDEARVVARLDHPHIVPLYDFVEHQGLCVIVMELATGGTLWDRFSRDGIETDEAVATVLAAAVGLHHAHRAGVLHRDVKPENVLFSASGTPKIADFGIAKSLEDGAASRTATGVAIGTPAYMAPEQVSGDDLSPLTDVYSLAVVLYELLTGELPYRSVTQAAAQMFQHVHDDPRPMAEVRPGIHPALEAVTRRALAKDPADRPGSAEELAVELAEAATAALGPGWLARGGFTVMSATAVVAATERPPAGAGPVTASGAERRAETQVVRAGTRHPRLGAMASAGAPPATVAPQASPVPPATVAPQASPVPPATPPASPAPSAPAVSTAPIQSLPPPPPTSAPAPPAPLPSTAPSAAPPAATSPASPARRRTGLILAAAAAVVVLALGAFLLVSRSGDDGGDRAAGPGSAAASPGDDQAALTAAERAEFARLCQASDVPDERCGCAADRATAELEPALFRANLDLMAQEDGGLIEEVADIFRRCIDDGF